MPEATQINESRDHYHPVDDLFQYDLAAGLEKLRGRLLDLSNRNQLLNFRYAGGRKGRRQLRFVEANMELVMKRLRAEEEYGFRVIPYPPPGGRTARPEMISFDEFTNNPETYLDGEEDEFLAPAGQGRMKAEEYALKLNIDTSYELPEVTGTGVQVEVGGYGNELQVLYYGDELDQVLRAIADVNRTAERETGLTTLYLVFGFVEWYDEAGGEVPRLAPLLLMPVVLGRQQTDGRVPGVVHTLEWTGEEVELNRTLQMMLRQRFGINLPEFRESDSLESYLLRVRPLLSGQPRWRIRHQLTLTNLSFHKLRMWEDLDPQSWPDNRLLEHPLVRDFFIGRPIETFSRTEESIDDLEVSGELPPLIFDADSSQHAALVEVQRGKSLVIEGPPGTGKSQTITNLIAAALNEGRTVLFVAEKTAALAVVQRKMMEAGLGDFCLCLGHRAEEAKDGEPRFLTRMRDIAGNLRQRIANKGSYELPARLGQKRDLLRDYRNRLNDYVWTINQPCGIGGGAAPPTIGQTIGIRERLYQSLVAVLGGPERMVELEAMRLEGADGLTLARIEAFEENAGIYQQALAQLAAGAERTRMVSPAAGPWGSPWAGLRRESLDPDEEQAILSALQSIIGLTNQIESELDSFTLENDLPLAGYERSVKRLIDLAPLLPVVKPGLARELLPVLADPESREAVRWLSRLGREHQAGQAAFSGEFSRLPELGSGELAQLKQACQQAAAADVETLTIDELRQKVEWLKSIAGYLTGAAPLFAQLVGYLECDLGYDLTSAKMLARALILLNEIPLKALPSRVPGLEREGIAPILTRARQEAEQLRKLANSLANRVDQNMAPPEESIVRYALICSNAGLFRFVSRDFREAERHWLGMVRQDEIRTTRQMARDYRDLLNYHRELHSFTTRTEYVELLGPHFKGLQTPFTDYDQLVKWYDRIKLIMGLVNEPARRLATALFTAPVASLKALIHFKDREVREQVEEFVRFFATFDRVLVDLPGLLHAEGIDDLDRLAGRLRELATEYGAIVEVFDRLQIDAKTPVGSLAAKFPALEGLGQLRELIEARQDLAPLLGGEAVTVGLDWERIDEAVDFVAQLEATALPTDFRAWLYSAEIDYRVEMMRATTDRLRILYNQYLLAGERFRAVTGIDEREWYGVEEPGRELSFSEVRRRAQEALRARDELPIWLIMRRAHQLMVRQGFGPLAELIEGGAIPIEQLTRSLVDMTRFIYYNSLLMGAFRRYPRLVDFNGVEQDEVRRRFAALDREVIALTRAEIASRVDQLHVPPGNSLGPISSYTELGLISHLVANRNSRIGIRPLVRNAAGALLALKPCFMMSPLAVAKYLPPESIRFDLVVMDEASQLRPEDALGAVARGGQLVVVGDRMQLPPTAFFRSVVEDETETVVDEAGWATAGPESPPLAVVDSGMESMLEIASARYQPIRQLQWHYRSRNESLIAFSKREFYHDRLMVFPAPVPAARSGAVRFCHVADGLYRQNRNQREAEVVVAAAIDHLINHPLESLGIVGLNLAQRQLLLELLERALRESPAAATRYQYWQARGEELLVKNLEMVQGDERDVIFISGTVGPDPDGRFRLSSFGPLNNTRDGHRRLNVLITRARQRVVFFSSILPELIQPGGNGSWGVRAVKDYLTFAMTGELVRPRHLEPSLDSEFEIAVAETLRARGLEVVSPVGAPGSGVDLAIRDPQHPDRYVLGIECDGSAYQGSRSARDRDRLRLSVLEGLGWNIHRIWSTDWLRSRDREIGKVLEKVTALSRPAGHAR